MNAPKRSALITGGSRGIGLGIARALAAEGLNLAICGLRPSTEVRGVVEDLRNSGVDVQYIQADVSSREQRAALLEAVEDAYGRLDVLVNNAGAAPLVRADLLDATEECFERLVRINVQGPHFLTQAAARWMIAQKDTVEGFRGCIVNIGSVSATVVSINRGEYCITKAGLAMSTRLWAVRLAPFGIPVYEVRPGIVLTDMTRPVQDRYQKLLEEGLVPQGRFGTPEDVGRAVAMLVRGELPYSTGSVILVDGGMTLDRL